eukprot:g18669.t1
MSQSFYLGADPRLNVHSLNIASKAVDLVISVVLTPILFGSAGARELFSWAEIWSNMLPSLGLAFTQGLQLIQLFFLTPGETIIGQLRIPLTAICSAWVLRKPYSKEQWMPLITITCAVFLFQLVKYQGKDTLGAASLVIGCCLGLTSCLAAVLSFLYRESLMKKSSATSFIIQNFQFNISMFVWHVGLCFVVFPYASGLLSAVGKAEVAKTQLFSTRGAIFQCRTSWEQRFEDLGSKLAGEIAGDDQFSKDLHMVWMSRLAPGTRRKVRKAIEKSASAAGEGGEIRAGPKSEAGAGGESAPGAVVLPGRRSQSFLGRENATPPSQGARGDQLRPGDNWKVSAEAAGGVLGRANAAPPSLGAREEDLLRSDDNWKVSSTEDINEQNGPAGGAQLELDKETTSNAALNASARSLGVASADSAGARSTSSDGDAMEQIKAKFDETARLVNGVSDMMNRNPFHADVVWASSEELVDNFSLSYPLDIDDGGELYHSQPQQQQEARGPLSGGSPAMYLASVSGRPPDSPGPLAPGRGSLLRIPVPPRGGAGAEPAADGAAEEPAPDREHYTREEQREDIRGRYSVVRDVLVNENNVYCRFNTFRDKKILRPKVPKEVTVSSATENAGEATPLFSPNAGTETPPSTRNLRLDMAPPRPPSNASGSSNNVGGAPPAGGAGSAGYSVPSSPRAVAAGAVVGRQHSAALSISWEEEDARHACFVFDGERKTWELRDYGRELLRGKIVEVTEESGHTVLGVPVEDEEIMAPVEEDGDVGSGECSGEQPEQSGTLIKKAEAQAQLAGLLREHGDPLLRLKNEEDGEDAPALVIAEDDESLANLQGRFESIEDSNGNRAVEGHSRDRDGPRIPAKDAERIFIMRGLFSPGNEGPSRCALICDASICREEYTGHWQYNYMGQAYYHEKLALHGVLKPYEGGFFKGWGWLIAIPIGAQCFQIWRDQVEMWMAGIITKQLSSVYRTLGQAVGAVCNVFIADYGFFQNPESKQERKTMEMIIFAFISVILGSSLVNFILAPPPPTGEEAKKTQKEDHEKTELTRTRTADVALKESDADVACGSDDDGFPGTDRERKGNTTTTMWEENEKLLR